MGTPSVELPRTPTKMSLLSTAWGLALTALALSSLSLWLQHSTIVGGVAISPQLVGQFNVDLERNVPTAFATLLLATACILLALEAAREFGRRGAARWHWLGLAIIFAAMTVDESLSYHERLVVPIRDLLGQDRFGIFYYAWVIPGIIFVVSVGLVFAKFLRDLPDVTRRRFLVAGALFVTGAIGVELAGGYHAELWGKGTFAYQMLCTAEEFLEMMGVVVFIFGLIEHRRTGYGVIRTLPPSSSSRSATASESKAAER